MTSAKTINATPLCPECKPSVVCRTLYCARAKAIAEADARWAPVTPPAAAKPADPFLAKAAASTEELVQCKKELASTKSTLRERIDESNLAHTELSEAKKRITELCAANNELQAVWVQANNELTDERSRSIDQLYTHGKELAAAVAMEDLDALRSEFATLEKLAADQEADLKSLTAKLTTAERDYEQSQNRCGYLADDLQDLADANARLADQRDSLLVERKSLQHQLEKLGAAFIRFVSL